MRHPFAVAAAAAALVAGGCGGGGSGARAFSASQVLKVFAAHGFALRAGDCSHAAACTRFIVEDTGRPARVPVSVFRPRAAAARYVVSVYAKQADVLALVQNGSVRNIHDRAAHGWIRHLYRDNVMVACDACSLATRTALGHTLADL